MSKAKEQRERQYATCFGLAEAMITQVEKGNYDPVTTMLVDGDSISGHLLHDIQLPVAERGDQKIFAATALAQYALGHHENDPDKKISMGWKNISDARAGAWISHFNPEDLQCNSARKTLNDLKDFFKKTEDPALDNRALEMRSNSYWMGPFPRHEGPFVHAIIGLVGEFHTGRGLAYREVHMHDAADTIYIAVNRDEFLPILEKEGLLTRGKSGV